jgi:hypothetical protein
MAIPFAGKRPPKQVAKSSVPPPPPRPPELPVGEVFVVGGMPTYTYVDRAEFGMEDRFLDALEDGGKIITISGPTKSGKTVFCKKMLPEDQRVWIGGGTVSNADDVWTAIIHKLDGATWRQSEASQTDQEGDEYAGEAGLNILAATARGEKRTSHTKTISAAKSKLKVSSPVHEATELLVKTKATLVIDDFHYLEERERVRVVRALKGPLEEGLRVVFLCVPHRAIEPIRAEREMQGRIEVISVPDWRENELREIATKGFDALNVAADDQVLEAFVLESFGSPHLMQEFCKHLCRMNKVRNKQLLAKALSLRDRDGFFRRALDGGAQDILDSLACGPLGSRARMQRNFINGETGDIYVAVLRAIANTGPKTKLTYNELRESLRDILADEPPAANEITRVLEKISEISKRRFGDRGAIDFEDTRRTIHVVDPFVAFYMRWGPPIGGEQ